MAANRRGFSLVEVIASVSLMSIAVLSVGAVSIRMARSESTVRSRAAQVAGIRRATAYWSVLPYSALPAAGSEVCETVTGLVPVQTCARSTTLALGTATGRRLILSARVQSGAAIRADTSFVDRVPPAGASPL